MPARLKGTLCCLEQKQKRSNTWVYVVVGNFQYDEDID